MNTAEHLAGEPAISVIVPIYNVEPYLLTACADRPCAILKSSAWMTAARTAAAPCWTNTRQKIRELSPCIRKMPAFRRRAMRECAWPEGNTSLLWTATTGWKERRMRIYCRSCKAGGRILSFSGIQVFMAVNYALLVLTAISAIHKVFAL